MSYFDPNVVLHIITSPNSAFTQIRDDEHRYFASSLAIFLLASAIGLLVMAPFAMIPLDNAYYEAFEENDIEVDIPIDWTDAAVFVGISILTGIISNILFYFIGKKLGGNANWKKVFSVLFYAHVPAIPMMILMSAAVFLMWSSLTAIDPIYLMDLDAGADEQEILALMSPVLAYVGLMIAIAIVFVVWIFIVSVKALKILNGFSTAKSFGLLILVMTLASFITYPLGM